jgi:hypothetical protein
MRKIDYLEMGRAAKELCGKSRPHEACKGAKHSAMSTNESFGKTQRQRVSVRPLQPGASLISDGAPVGT